MLWPLSHLFDAVLYSREPSPRGWLAELFAWPLREKNKFYGRLNIQMGWTVLCVSKISPAQITRNMILERAGYQIIAIDDPGEALRIFKACAVNAVVFGDSVNGEQRFQLARTFKSLNAAVPIVALSNTSGSQMPRGIVDQHLESLGDPHLLLEALKRVLSRDGDGSALAPAHDQPRTGDGDGPAKAASLQDGDGASARISPSNTPKNSEV